MARRKTVEFNFNKVYELIESLDKNKEEAVTEAIKTASKFVQNDLAEFAESKAETGQFRKALKEDLKVENNHGRIELQLGFYKDKPHGMVANYFNKGTPTIKKTGFIDKAFRNKKAIGAMNYVLGMYWRNNQEYINKIKESNK